VNLLLLHDDDFESETRARVDGRRCKHVRRILKKKPGDTLVAGRANGLIGTATILELSKESLVVDVDLSEAPPAPLPGVLVLALPRPPVMARALAAATSLGIKHIVLLQTQRVERTYWGATAMTADSLHDKLCLGLEQARDTRLPELWLRERFKPFVEDELPDLLDGATGIFAHPGASIACPARLETPAVVAIGPEGGFIDFELEKLQEAGMSGVTLGTRALRVETAMTALLSRLL
jgi:16S rRNA (uracil1498-N3)-methyltransferase